MKEEHYFTKKPTSRETSTAVSFSFEGRTLRFLCVSGVFSADHVDFATSLLLHHARLDIAKSVLDVGCGVGIIGLSIKKAYPDKTVVCTDVNQRALKYTKKNAEKNSVDVEVLESDLFLGLQDRKFDAIISNPPHHAGRDVVFSLIEESINHLNEGGTLQLVARHSKGGKMIEKKMHEVFGNVETLVKKGGFRVYCSTK